MTPPTSPQHPAGPHPSVDDLADLAEGLTDSPATAVALRAHLAGCPDCRDTLAALTEVQDLLGAVETPPMPTDVARRLDAALAAEAAAPRTPAAGPALPPPGPRSAPAAPPAGPGRSHAGPGRRPRRRVLLGTAFALAAAVLGAVLLNVPGPDRHADSVAGAAVEASAASPGRLGPLASPLTPTFPGGNLAPGAQPSGQPSTQPSTQPSAGSEAGTAYRADTLAAQIRHLLSTGKDAAQSPADGGGPTAAGAPCAPANPSPLLATDHGTFEGSPVDVLVYATPGSPELLDVYLVDSGCAADPAPVRLHRTVPLH